MTKIRALSTDHDNGPGYRVITESAGTEYHTDLQRVDTDGEETVVEPVERWSVDKDGSETDRDGKATDAVTETLEDRGVVVRE
jgi:hypothetical protein